MCENQWGGMEEAEPPRTLLRRSRQEPATTMREEVRQDVRIQSYRIQFTLCCCSKILSTWRVYGVFAELYFGFQ